VWGNGGFWRLRHDDLAALLARRDLSWELARVYLALGDLTLGWGKTRDIVSLGEIAEHTGLERRHVVRALKRLAALGLYHQAEVQGEGILRWITWPPPSVPKGVPKGVPKSVPGAGTYQDSKTCKTSKKCEEVVAAPITFDEASATFVVPPELRQRWKAKYPGVDVDAEIAKAAEWHAARLAQYAADGRMKCPWTPAGYQRALVNWLARAAQDLQRAGHRTRGTFTPAVPTSPNKYAHLGERFD
jgi:hypothetical protein